MPRRLRPTAEIHPDAILVGDPGRAMALAQVLTEGPKMANHARGLWGYSGTTAGRARADRAGDRDGRAERRAGARRPGRAGGAAGDPGRDLRGARARARARATWSASARRGRGRSTVAARGRRPIPTRIWRRGCGPSSARRRAPGRVASLDVLHPSRGHATPRATSPTCRPPPYSAPGRSWAWPSPPCSIVTDAEGAGPLDDDSWPSAAALAAQPASRALI